MQHKLPIGITVLGVVVVAAAAILGWAVMPKVIDKKISDETQLKEGSETLEKWADIPYPIYLSFHVFHVNNPEEVEAGGTPNLTERGPYAYRQSRIKVNMTHDDVYDPENTIQYRERKTYFFDQERSKTGDKLNTEDDLVNIINIAYVSVVHAVRVKLSAVEFMFPLVANGFLGTEQLIKRDVRVGDLLFDGFNVSLYTENPVLALALPDEFSGGRFGLYKGENGTDSKVYNIYTGIGGYEEFGLIKTYDGKQDLGFWVPNTPCDLVKGSDGSLYPPFVEKDREIDVFSTDLCRSLRFTYLEESEHQDIPAYRFTVPKWTLEDPRINTENVCYCLSEKVEDCPHAGAMSLEGCRNGAPIMMSTPYFLDAYDGYRNDSGLPEPDPEKHMTYLDIEPHSGVLLRGHKRIQVNVQVQIDNRVDVYQNLTKNMVFPLIWADEHAEMDEENAQELKDKLLKPLKIVDIARWTVLGVGAAILIAGIGWYVIRRQKSKETV